MNNNKDAYLLVIGASVVDIFGFSTTKYLPYNSTPGKIKFSYGGVCRNIAENMARTGVKTKFISILGDDENGYNMMEHSKKIGYDMSESLIVEGRSTPTYLAILNEEGEMVSAISDMKIINEMDIGFINKKSELIKNAEFVFVDADNPKILEYLLKNFSETTRFILDPVSAAKAEKIKHLIKYFHTVKPNRHEAEILVGFPIIDDNDLIKACDYFLGLGVKKVFISLDSEGIFYSDGKVYGKTKANDVYVKNVTGAGDAFVAGVGYGYYNNMSIDEVVKFAITMSTITISHTDTIHPEMNLELVKKEYNEIIWSETKF